MKKYCINCGNEIKENDIYCLKCGIEIGNLINNKIKPKSNGNGLSIAGLTIGVITTIFALITLLFF